jgi:hypothetical protein
MPSLSENLLVLVGLFGGATLGVAIGVTYFVKANRDAKLSLRALTSAFGPSLAVIFVAATIWWPEQYRYQPKGVLAFYWLQILPLVLACCTLAKYPGPARLHLVLVPLGLFAWLWTFFLGWIFVHGE